LFVHDHRRYFVIPGVVRASTSGPESAELVRHRGALERIAFGTRRPRAERAAAIPSGEAAVRTIPILDPHQVGTALGRRRTP